MQQHLPVIEDEVDPEKGPEETLPQPFLREGPFGIANICLGKKGDKQTYCQVVTRLVMRLMRNELMKGIPGEIICDRLNEANLIHLFEESPEGADA
jgi:hypothetical protein